MDQKQSVVNELINECETTWQGIQETHHRLANHLGKEPGVVTENYDAMVSLLQNKERRLKARLDIIRKQDIEVVSKDGEFLQTLLHIDLKKTIEQQGETLTIIKRQRQELAGEIERVRKIVKEQEETQNVLEQKLSIYQEQDESADETPNKLLEGLQKRKKEAKEFNRKSMRQLGKFISEYFPKPTDEGDKGLNGKEPETYCSLLHLIEMLMNHLFESPNNPYIPLQPTYWQPYIELLLRYGIIQRHPNNSNLVCLVAYHLK